jgi:hypothetical protein
MPRTTLDLDRSVLEELRRRGRREGKSMGQVASEVLAAGLRADDAAAPATFEWIGRDLGTPRIDLEDKEAVRAALEEGH